MVNIEAFDMRNGITFIGKLKTEYVGTIELEDVVRTQTKYITTPEIVKEIYNAQPHFLSAIVSRHDLIANYVVETSPKTIPVKTKSGKDIHFEVD